MTSIISRSDAPASVSAVTSTRLADGRELLYFDDTSHPLQRPSRDRRDLPERGPSGEIRYDALTGEWVAVAAHRQHRTHLPPADECPLCPSTDARPSEIPADYDVAVFENRFPSLGPDFAAAPASPGWGSRGLAGGRCEVVAFTPAHVQADINFFTGRTAQYVFISSASAYQTPPLRLPVTESTPLRNPNWRYTRDNIASEDRLA